MSKKNARAQAKAKQAKKKTAQEKKFKAHKKVTQHEWKLRSEKLAELVKHGPVTLPQLCNMYANRHGGSEHSTMFKREQFVTVFEKGFLPDLKWRFDVGEILVSLSENANSNGHAAPPVGCEPHHVAQSTGGPSRVVDYGRGNTIVQPRKLVLTNEKYLLVSDRTSFERGLETVCSLCNPGARTLGDAISGIVALDLKGFNLGSERGTLSMVQMMATGWPVPLLFDIVELNKYKESTLSWVNTSVQCFATKEFSRCCTT